MNSATESNFKAKYMFIYTPEKMLQNFGLIVGIVCLSFGSLLSAAPSSSSRRSLPLPLCSSEWSELHITADNDFDIYIEGTQYETLYNANNWTMSDYVPLEWYSSAVAIKATDSGAMAGILGSSPLFLTDASWKCTNEYEDGWEQPSFDDSTWPAATVIGKHGVAPWGQVGGISSEASWIWTSKYIYGPDSDKIVYCRKKFCQRCLSTGSSCISSCDELTDGDYQSCKGCQVYASCSNGILYDERPCAPRNTYWDDNEKLCLHQSFTCDSCS